MNEELNGFGAQEAKVKWLKLPIYLLGAAFMSQLVMFLDDALIVAYVVCPYLGIRMWASDSMIKWSNNKCHHIIYSLVSITFVLMATLFVLEVLSFEENATHSTDIYLFTTAVELIAEQNKN